MAANLPKSRIRPSALRKGDKVGIVAPASNIKRELLEAGCDSLRAAGYEPFYFASILERDLYFAGSVERRVRELEEMFVREEDMDRTICCRRLTSQWSLRIQRFSSDTATSPRS